MRIALLILNYNGGPLVNSFLRGAGFLKGSKEFDTFVIDNASLKPHIDPLKERFPWAKFIENDSNYGWGGGYNHGLAQIPDPSAYDFLCFINNDTKISEKWARENIEYASKLPTDVGEFGCRALYDDLYIKEDLLTSDNKGISHYVISGKDVDTSMLTSDGVLQTQLIPESPELLPSHLQKVGVKSWYMVKISNTSSSLCSLNLNDKLTISETSKLNDYLSLVTCEEGPGGEKQVHLGPKESVLLLRRVRDESTQKRFIQNSGLALNDRFEGYDLHGFDAPETPQNTKDLRGVCGVCKFVRPSVYQQLGGFDDHYFMYYEDLDFSLRLNAAGYKSLINSESHLLHKHRGSSQSSRPFFDRQVLASLYYFHHQHAAPARKARTWLRFWLYSLMEKQKPFSKARPFSLARQKFNDNVSGGYLFGN